MTWIVGIRVDFADIEEIEIIDEILPKHEEEGVAVVLLGVAKILTLDWGNGGPELPVWVAGSAFVLVMSWVGIL